MRMPRNTTLLQALVQNSVTAGVGVPRIELGSYAPEAYIIPLYDTPTPATTKIFATIARKIKEVEHANAQPHGAGRVSGDSQFGGCWLLGNALAVGRAPQCLIKGPLARAIRIFADPLRSNRYPYSSTIAQPVFSFRHGSFSAFANPPRAHWLYKTILQKIFLSTRMCTLEGSNSRPRPCEGRALTN